MSSYEKNLATHLRINGQTETEIRDIIGEVTESRAEGVDVVAEFGPPEKYASSFPARKPTARQRVPLYIAMGLGLTWILVTMVLLSNGWSPQLGNIDLEDLPTGLTVLVPALILMVVGLLVNFAIHVRPRR